MDPQREELKKCIDELNAKTDAIYTSVEKTRKYFLTTMIVTLVALVLPLIGLLFAIPPLLSTYGSLQGL